VWSGTNNIVVTNNFVIIETMWDKRN